MQVAECGFMVSALSHDVIRDIVFIFIPHSAFRIRRIVFSQRLAAVRIDWLLFCGDNGKK